MNIPKLNPVGSDLNRVESAINPSVIQENPLTNLERSISASELIVYKVASLIPDLSNKEVLPFVQNFLNNITDSINDQKLSFQLLRLLSNCNGSKAIAAEKLKIWVDTTDGGNK
jgi:hypothetical protein